MGYYSHTEVKAREVADLAQWNEEKVRFELLAVQDYLKEAWDHNKELQVRLAEWEVL